MRPFAEQGYPTRPLQQTYMNTCLRMLVGMSAGYVPVVCLVVPNLEREYDKCLFCSAHLHLHSQTQCSNQGCSFTSSAPLCPSLFSGLPQASTRP